MWSERWQSSFQLRKLIVIAPGTSERGRIRPTWNLCKIWWFNLTVGVSQSIKKKKLLKDQVN